jgi:hypothetical protein
MVLVSWASGSPSWCRLCIGKSVMSFRVVNEKLGSRSDAAICYIGFLFPLWDARRQTIADMLRTTVCLPV